MKLILYLNHIVVRISIHFPLEHPLGIHELTVGLPHACHHVDQHHCYHALLIQVLLMWPLLKCGFERISHMKGGQQL